MRLLLASVVEVNASLSVGGVGVTVDSVNDQNDPHVVVQFGAANPTSTVILLALDLSNSTAL